MKKWGLFLIVAVHALVFWIFFHKIFLLYTNLDEGILLDGAKRILSGQVPLKDFFYFHIPGDIYLFALFFKAFGESYVTAKFVMLFFTLMSDLCILSLVHSFSKEWILPGISSLFYLTIVFPLMSISHDWLSVFFVFLTTWLLFESVEKQDNPFLFKPLLFMAGMFCGFTGLIHESRGIYLLPLSSFYILAGVHQTGDHHFQLKKRLRAVLIFLAGTGIVLITFFYFSVYTGSFPYYMNTIKWLLTNYKAFNRYPFLYTQFALIKRSFSVLDIKDIWHGINVVIIIIAIIFIPLIVVTGTILRYMYRMYKRKATQQDRILLLLAISYLVLFLSTLYKPEAWRIHDFTTPAFLILLFCLIWLLTAEILKSIQYKKIIPPVYVIIITFTIFLSLYNLKSFADIATRAECNIQTGDNKVKMISDAYCKDINELYGVISQAPSGPMFVYHWTPILYFLFDRNNATSFDSYMPLYNTPEQMDQIIKELQANRPLYIVMDSYDINLLDPSTGLYWLFPLLDRRWLFHDPVHKYIYGHYRVDRYLRVFTLLKRME